MKPDQGTKGTMIKSKGKFVALSGGFFGGSLFAFFMVYGFIRDPPIRVDEIIFLAIISPIAGWIWAELMWLTFKRLERIQQKKVQTERKGK
jgi:hypothetical protein